MGYLLGTLLMAIFLSHATCQETSCYESVDILFIMDGSSSVGLSDFQKQLQFASTFINKFRFGPARFSVLRFDTNPNITVNFGDYQDVTGLKNAVAKINYLGGGTDTAAALKLAREQAFQPARGARAGVPKVAIVSTDGLSNNPVETREEAKRLRDSGVLVLSIGVGTEYNKAELEAMATHSVDVYEVIDYNMLLSIVNDYSELVCTVVKLFQCNNEADIFFLLDSSIQIDQFSFQNQLSFVRNVSNSLKLTRNKFGVVTFGASVQPVFKLRQFNASNELALALSGASPVQGVTDLDQVLRYVRDQAVFDTSVGGRDNATKILVLATNGGSSSGNQAKVTASQLRQSGINLLAVGVSSPNLTQLQELTAHPVLDVVTNLANSAVAASRIETLTALTQCKLPQFGGNQESEYCRIYNWENGIHPHPKDCTKFIECTFLRTDVMRCPPDLAYDRDLQTCTYKNQVTACFGAGVVTPPGGNVTPPPESSCQDIQLADIVLVLDSSNSISPADYLSQLRFVASITEEFSLGAQQVRFGAVIFSTDTVKLFDLKDFSTHDTLKSAILSAPHLKTGTDTARALNFVYDQNMFGPGAGGRVNATKILIVMTDGRSNSMEDTLSAALKLKSSGVRVLAIGIGEDIYLAELQQIASSQDNLFTVPGFQALDQIKGQVTSQTCSKPCVKGQLDILLIIDSSDTVGVTTYGAELRLAANLAENFHLGPNDVQFGTLTFGTSPHLLFSFNRHWDYKSLQTEILRAPFLGGNTQTHLALQSSLNLFDASHGARPGAPRLAILLTNGRSTDPVQTERQAAALKQAGVHVIVVGFVEANLAHLQNIASVANEVFFNNFNGVLAAIRDFSSHTCTVAPICRGLQLADVLFLLDSSNSITSPDYGSQLQFVANLTAGFTVGPDHVRFGGVIFSTDTVKLFDLKDHDDLTTLRSAILSAPHLKTGTDTARALNFVYDQNMFGPGAGGRVNATKILIVMTDGRSNSMEDTLAASLRLKSSGVKVLAIGIGSEIYLEELVQLASNNQSLFTVSGFDKLNEALQAEVTKQTCDNLKNPENIPDVSLLCSTFHWADGEHPNPYDCSTYVRCQSLVTSVVHCPVGLAFDPRLVRCIDKSIAHPCNDSSYFGPTATPAPVRPTTTGRPSFVITDICNIFKLADGIYPDPGNCDHFVECTAFLTQYLQCPAGLNYNTVNQVCDDVHVIDCQVNYHFYDRFITG